MIAKKNIFKKYVFEISEHNNDVIENAKIYLKQILNFFNLSKDSVVLYLDDKKYIAWDSKEDSFMSAAWGFLIFQNDIEIRFDFKRNTDFIISIKSDSMNSLKSIIKSIGDTNEKM